MKIFNNGQRRFISFSNEEIIILKNSISLPSIFIEINEYEIIEKTIFKLFSSTISELKGYYLAKVFRLTDSFEFHPYKPKTVTLSKGTILYHLTSNIKDINKCGFLIGGGQTADGIRFSEKRIYFSINKDFLKDISYCDIHLKNRNMLELVYDGSYELFLDPEFDGTENMVYVKTDKLYI